MTLRRVLGLVAGLVLLGTAVGAASALPPRENEGSDDPGGSIPMEADWVDGQNVSHDGCHFGVPQSFVAPVLSSNMAYQTADSLPPKLGQTWWGAVHLGVIGNPCIGTIIVDVDVQLPPGTSFAVDSAHKIKCEFLASGATQASDVTSDPVANCPANGGQGLEGLSLGMRELPAYSQFTILFPLKSTAPPGGKKLVGVVRPSTATTGRPEVVIAAPAPPPPAKITAATLSALIECFWNNPNNPGPC